MESEWKLVGCVLNDDCVTGIVSTLITDHRIRTFGEVICNLSFSFVAPLGAYNYNSGHFTNL